MASRNGLPTAKHQSPTRTCVAVAQFRDGKIVAAQQLDQGHVAGRIEADDHGVVQLPVGHAALHVVAGRLGDVKIGQRVAVGRDDDARAAALAVVGKDGDGRLHRLGHRGDPLLLGLQDRVGHWIGLRGAASRLRTDEAEIRTAEER